MKFFLEPIFPKFSVELKHENPILLWGSCFSDELAGYFTQAGFQIQSNLLGTVFHPLAIIKQLESLLSNSDEACFEYNKQWYSWNASHTLRFDNQEAYGVYFQSVHESFMEWIQKKDCTFIITLGSAWGYTLKSSNTIVANCHKQPSQLFDKVFATPDEIARAFESLILKLYQLNPSLRVCFTVSPVRHIRDGLIENNQSKASLIEALRQIQLRLPQTVYLPTYELVLDVLRDYRFYKEDLVHPNDQAIHFVWNFLKQHTMSQETAKLSQEAVRFTAFKGHIPVDTSEEANQKRMLKLQSWQQELAAKGVVVNLV